MSVMTYSFEKFGLANGLTFLETFGEGYKKATVCWTAE
jgi:hypothetical protein